MPRARFEPKIPLFERVKTDRAYTMTGTLVSLHSAKHSDALRNTFSETHGVVFVTSALIR
jgi:hypothetical protein